MTLQFSQNDPSSTLRLSQQARSIIPSLPPEKRSFPLNLLDKTESPTVWADCERLFQACLRSGDDKAAHLCVEGLANRFGASDVRVVGLRGMYQEAVASNATNLNGVLQSYEKILEADPVNVPVLKRRIAVKKSLSRPQEAISALVEYVESNVTDAEAWCELADLYQSQAMTAQAIFCAEEAILIAPNAWNLHARLGEIEYSSAATGSGSTDASQQLLADAARRFSRSIELCDDYLRGYYGLKKTCQKLLQGLRSSTTSSSSGIPPPKIINGLHELAHRKLEAIVVARGSQKLESESMKAELVAVQELLRQSPLV